VYIDNGSSMLISPSKSRDLADEKKQNFDGMEMIRNNRILILRLFKFKVIIITVHLVIIYRYQ
jgi:hypothetical protein